MKLFNFEVSESLVVGLLSIFIFGSMLLHYKPSVMFTQDGQFKKFGTGNTNINTLYYSKSNHIFTNVHLILFLKLVLPNLSYRQ